MTSSTASARLVAPESGSSDPTVTSPTPGTATRSPGRRPKVRSAVAFAGRPGIPLKSGTGNGRIFPNAIEKFFDGRQVKLLCVRRERREQSTGNQGREGIPERRDRATHIAVDEKKVVEDVRTVGDERGVIRCIGRRGRHADRHRGGRRDSATYRRGLLHVLACLFPTMLSHDAAPLGNWPVSSGGNLAIAQVKNVLWITSRLPMQCVAQANARFGQLKVLTLYVLGGHLRSPTRQTAFSDVALSRWRRRAVATIRRTLRLVRSASDQAHRFPPLL